MDQHVKLSRGASYLIIQTLGVNVIMVVSFVILARLISPQQMGIWTILQLVNATCVAGLAWFTSAVTKFIAENSVKEMKAAAAVFYQALRTTSIMFLPVVIGIYLGATFLASHLVANSSYALLFQILALDVFAYGAILPIVSAALLGLRMFRETAVVGLVVGGFVRQFLILFLIIEMKNLVGLVIGWTISDAATAIIYLMLAVRVLGPPTFDFSLNRLVRFSLPLELSSITSFAQTWFDRALLVLFVPLATLGIYNAALTAFGALGSVSVSMSNMLLPAFSSIQQRTSLREGVRLATRYASLTLTPLAFCLLATAKPAITVFVGHSYVEGSMPLMIFSGALGVTAFATALAPLFLALEETKLSAAITGVTVLISLGVAYLLLPEFGIIGAATARALATILGAVLMVVLLGRKITLQLDRPMIIKTLIASGTMACAILAVQLVHYAAIMLPLYVLVGMMVYFLMLRLLKAVNESDIELIRKFLGARLTMVSRILGWLLLPRDRASKST